MKTDMLDIVSTDMIHEESLEITRTGGKPPARHREIWDHETKWRLQTQFVSKERGIDRIDVHFSAMSGRVANLSSMFFLKNWWKSLCIWLPRWVNGCRT